MFGLLIWVFPIVLFVLFAYRQRSSAQKELDSSQQSVAIHRERLAELSTRRDSGDLTEEEFESFRLEEEKALLADSEVVRRQSVQNLRLPWSWVVVTTIVLMGVSWVTYTQVGASDAVAVREQFRQLATNSDLQPEQIESTLDSYQTLLESDPENIEGWFRLSRMQMDMERFEAAIGSLEHVLEQLRAVEHNAEDEAAILSYIAQSQTSLGRIEEALTSYEKSLEYSQSANSLGMAGRLSYDLGRYEKAIDYWTRLKLSNSQTDASVIDEFIDSAKAQLAAQGIDYEAVEPERIIVKVSLPAAWEGLSDQAALFVYARPVGQRMPLAVKRMPVRSQQIAVMLSDDDAMGPMGGISTQDVVEVTARISLTGIANTQPGDWIGNAEKVNMDDESLEVAITIQQP